MDIQTLRKQASVTSDPFIRAQYRKALDTAEAWEGVKGITAPSAQHAQSDLNLELEQNEAGQGRVLSYEKEVFTSDYAAARDEFNRRIKAWYKGEGKTAPASSLVT
jgi:hypothetical protein